MATLDVVTLDEVKDRLGGSVARTTNDNDLEADITALSALFDDRFGAIVQRAVTDEQVTLDRCQRDITDYWPILASPVPTVDTGDVEIIDRQFGILEFSDTDASEIGYTAGRFADTASVSEQFKAAFVIALRNWRQAGHIAPHVPANPDYPAPRTSFPTFAMPNAAIQMLAKYQRHEGLA